ncbi:MAG: DUF6152 family protein [Gammaproteobacteria bacterium]
MVYKLGLNEGFREGLPVIRKFLIVQILACAFSHPAWGHHDVSGDMDIAAPVEIVGQLLEVEWGSPHSTLRVEVERAGAANQVWRIQADSTTVLANRAFNVRALSGLEMVAVIAFPSTGSSCGDVCSAYGLSLRDPNNNSYTLSGDISDRLRDYLRRN